jgi:hypothetical protein
MSLSLASYRLLPFAALLLSIAACGDEGSGDAPTEDTSTDSADTGADTAGDTGVDTSNQIQATPRPALVRPQLGACNLDFDCGAGTHCFTGRCVLQCAETATCGVAETCSDRGRCTNPNKGLDDAADTLGLSFAVAPGRSVKIGRAATTVILPAKLRGDRLPEQISFRVEDSAGLLDATILRTAPVVDGTVDFEIPLLAEELLAQPDNEVAIRLSSEAGSFTIAVGLEPGGDAAYSGQVFVSTFGTIGIPVAFEIVTEPADATLEAATSAWLVLPSGVSHVFSPTPPTASESWLAQPLTFDPLLNSWVASFRHNFPLASTSVLDPSVTDGIQRTLRFELQSDSPGSITGRFTDRWTGIYDSRSAGGVVEAQPVVFQGDLEALRVGPARAQADLVIDTNDAVAIARVALPGLDSCTATVFGTPGAPTTANGASGIVSCGAPDASGNAILSLEQFTAASTSDAQRAECALAVAETSLLGETTGALLLQFFNGDGSTPGNQTFSEFMAKCAAGTGGLCRPSAEVLCGRQLLAYAYSAPVAELAASGELVDAYQRVTREAFLGRQLGAFQTDADTREAWLKTSDYPAIVTRVLRDFTAGLLNDWKEQVLDAHLDVVGGQYDAAGLAMLSRQLTDPAAIDGRQQLLFEMSQSWRGAMESLTLGTQRWNALLFDAAERAATSNEVATRSLDLYLLAGVASNLNLRAGAGFANASFGAGFGALARERRKLNLPFDELIYARDAEVVVSSSLDPQDDNFNLLGRLEDEANAAIGEAAGSVGAIISEGTERELSTAQVRNRLNNEADALRDELITLCGLPEGCTTAEVGVRAGCDIQVAPGKCGFRIEQVNGELNVTGTNVSDAASAVYAAEQAHNSELIAMAELTAAELRSELADSRAKAFATSIEQWNTSRLSTTEEIKVIIENRSAAWGTSLKGLADNIASRNAARATLAADATADVAAWNQIRVNGISTDFGKIRAQFALRQTADAVDLAATVFNRNTDAAIAGLPQCVGASTDIGGPERFAAMTAANIVSGLADAAAFALRTAAGKVEIARDQAKALREANLSNLREQDLADDQATQDEIDALRDQAQVDLSAQQIAELQVDRLIEALRERAEAELAYQRDLTELEDRRGEAKSALDDLAALSLRVGQAGLGVSQKLLEYKQVVQRAELIAGRLAVLDGQRQNINQLLGSPAVVFAWANRLSAAESELERAKVALMNWLVGMEYYAVRPFMDQRIQILLARNTYQLKDIAREMTRLQDKCGGALNTASAEVSVARLIGADLDESNAETAELASPKEMFQARIRRGDVSVDRRVRLSGEIAGADVATRRDLLSTTVTLDIERFANLGSACNAKIVSFDVELVGENLGDGLLPTVNIVYDGTSSVRSCQPNLSDYVARFGPGATAFGELTSFRSPARSVSIVAGQGEFPTDGFAPGGNRTLSGLPLASNYTVIIDPTLGDNRQVAWENLEDIRLRVNYGYQDFFVPGVCE